MDRLQHNVLMLLVVQASSTLVSGIRRIYGRNITSYIIGSPLKETLYKVIPVTYENEM